MGVLTDFLKLFKSTEDEYYDVETQQNENWDKVETFAKKTDREIGDLTGLQTSKKNNLVNAINENNTKLNSLELKRIFKKNVKGEANKDLVYDLGSVNLNNYKECILIFNIDESGSMNIVTLPIVQDIVAGSGVLAGNFRLKTTSINYRYTIDVESSKIILNTEVDNNVNGCVLEILARC